MIQFPQKNKILPTTSILITWAESLRDTTTTIITQTHPMCCALYKESHECAVVFPTHSVSLCPVGNFRAFSLCLCTTWLFCCCRRQKFDCFWSLSLSVVVVVFGERRASTNRIKESFMIMRKTVIYRLQFSSFSLSRLEATFFYFILLPRIYTQKKIWFLSLYKFFCTVSHWITWLQATHQNVCMYICLTHNIRVHCTIHWYLLTLYLFYFTFGWNRKCIATFNSNPKKWIKFKVESRRVDFKAIYQHKHPICVHPHFFLCENHFHSRMERTHTAQHTKINCFRFSLSVARSVSLSRARFVHNNSSRFPSRSQKW